MDMDFANPTPARPAPVRLESGSCTLARAFAPRFLQIQPRGWPHPCVLLPFTSIRLVGDFHPQAVKHAQHRWDRRPCLSTKRERLLLARLFYCCEISQ